MKIIWNSVSVNFYGYTAVLICLRTFCGCFPATEAKVSNCSRDCVVLSWFLCHWLEQGQLQSHSWHPMAFGVSYVLPYCDLNAKFPVHILYVKTRKKDKSGLTVLLVRHNGVWFLLLPHYKARCCVYCAMTLKLCLRSTRYISRTRLSIHQNIPKSERSVVRKIRKFKTISHHDRIFLHTNKKWKRIHYQN